jgi:hypothetical protein
MADKIATKAHEKFGLTIPATLGAETDGDVAVVLRDAVREDPDSPVAGEALRFLESHKLKGAYREPR